MSSIEEKKDSGNQELSIKEKQEIADKAAKEYNEKFYAVKEHNDKILCIFCY